jgi:hypothetical protein
MASITKAPSAVKCSRPKPERTCRLGNPVNGVYPLLLTVGTGPKAKRFGYYVHPLPSRGRPAAQLRCPARWTALLLRVPGLPAAWALKHLEALAALAEGGAL